MKNSYIKLLKNLVILEKLQSEGLKCFVWFVICLFHIIFVAVWLTLSSFGANA